MKWLLPIASFVVTIGFVAIALCYAHDAKPLPAAISLLLACGMYALSRTVTRPACHWRRKC